MIRDAVFEVLHDVKDIKEHMLQILHGKVQQTPARAAPAPAKHVAAAAAAPEPVKAAPAKMAAPPNAAPAAKVRPQHDRFFLLFESIHSVLEECIDFRDECLIFCVFFQSPRGGGGSLRFQKISLNQLDALKGRPYTVASADDVRSNMMLARAALNQWDIVRLAGNMKFDGAGYGNKIGSAQPSEAGEVLLVWYD